MPQWAIDLWNWTKANDLSNWIVVAFTLVVWPLALIAWSRRKVNNVPHLEVTILPGNIVIGGHPHVAVAIDFTNHTGSVVYITGTRIKECTSQFSVPTDASRDIAEGSYHLSFLDAASGGFDHRELTLQTNESGRTAIAVTAPMPPGFYTYRAPRYRRFFRSPKYFILEYTAMVGASRHAVATVY
jgi:hypothetical protein